VYRSQHKQVSTAFNFVDVIGVGYSFGASREHELGLRVVHVSNADIRKPNPGMDSVQLRYARVF
jgi:lipid A 3-O-deacylase